MRYLKRFISTLTTMSYYSSSNAQLDDHLTPTYLDLISEGVMDEQTEKSEEDISYALNYWSDKSLPLKVNAEMNNSYSSSQQNI